MYSVAVHSPPKRQRRGAKPALPSVVGGRYRIDQVLAESVATVVYSALHLDLGQPVAIKALRPEHLADPAVVSCFLDDARRGAAVVCRELGRVTDLGTLPDGAPFAVLDVPRGESLERVLETKGRLDVDQSVDFVIQACRAASRIHAAGMVHGDIKPSNLFVNAELDGSLVVKLFSLDVPPSCFTRNAALGSPAYMAPEQVAHAPDVDQRADVWALGVVLFELLTGRTPFRGESNAELFAEILGQPPPSVSRLGREVDRGLESIVMRALEKDPKNRFPNAGALADALRARADPAGAADDELLDANEGRASHLVLFGMIAAACAAALVLLALAVLPVAWKQPAPELAAGAHEEREPRVQVSAEPVRGVYSAHPSRDSAGNPALPGEPAGPDPKTRGSTSSESHTEYLARQGMTTVEEVVVKERRYYDSAGNLIGVETRLFDPAAPVAAKERSR